MNDSSPVKQLVTHRDKGGQYEVLGTSTRAGVHAMSAEEVIVYRSKDSGRLFHRSPLDFAQKMDPLAAKPGPYDIEEYAFDQWWVQEMQGFVGEVTDDFKRAVGMALNFMEAAFVKLGKPIGKALGGGYYEDEGGNIRYLPEEIEASGDH